MPMNDVIALGSEMKLLKPTDMELLNTINFPQPFSEEHRAALLQVVEQKRTDYVTLFVKLLNSMKRHDCVGCLLEFLAVMVESSSFTEHWAHIGPHLEHVDPVQPLIDYLEGPTEIMKKAYTVLAAILCSCAVDQYQQQINRMLDSCIVNLHRTSSDSTQLELSVHALTFFVRNRAIRRMLRKKKALGHLVNLVVEHSADVQVTYEVGFCLWMLSYDDKTCRALLKLQIVPKLHDMLKNYKKEKVARIALMTLTNLSNLQQKIEQGRADGEHYYVAWSDDDVERDDTFKFTVFQDMLSVGMYRTLVVQMKKTFADPDIAKMLEALVAILEKNIDDSSSFADYRQEVLSGRLDWTPVHKSERFWKENIKEFESEDFKVLQELANLLKSTTNPTVMAVALHDFGEFVKYHPQGRKVVNSLAIKGNILSLMEHTDAEVQKQALLCSQKILVQKWEFLGQSS